MFDGSVSALSPSIDIVDAAGLPVGNDDACGDPTIADLTIAGSAPVDGDTGRFDLTFPCDYLNDTGSGDDIVHGDGGADERVSGGTGNDTVRGGDGDDVLITGNGGSDQVYGDRGNDVLVTGGPRPDVILGGPGNDLLRGNKGADRLFGEDGDDQLFGSEQPDALDGGEGNDFCNGGSEDEDPTLIVSCETQQNIP